MTHSEHNKMERIIYNANQVLEVAVMTPGTKDSMPKELFEMAKAIAIVTLLEIGFMVSGSIGSGIMVAKDKGTGKWSAPCAVELTGSDWSFSAGRGNIKNVLVFFMDDHVVEQALSGKKGIKLGLEHNAEVSTESSSGKTLTLGEVDLLKEALSNEGFSGTISVVLSESSSSGPNLEGRVLRPRHAVNKEFYGEEEGKSPIQILQGTVAVPANNMDAKTFLDAIYTKLDMLSEEAASVKDSNRKDKVDDKPWAEKLVEKADEWKEKVQEASKPITEKVTSVATETKEGVLRAADTVAYKAAASKDSAKQEQTAQVSDKSDKATDKPDGWKEKVLEASKPVTDNVTGIAKETKEGVLGAVSDGDPAYKKAAGWKENSLKAGKPVVLEPEAFQEETELASKPAAKNMADEASSEAKKNSANRDEASKSIKEKAKEWKEEAVEASKSFMEKANEWKEEAVEASRPVTKKANEWKEEAVEASKPVMDKANEWKESVVEASNPVMEKAGEWKEDAIEASKQIMDKAAEMKEKTVQRYHDMQKSSSSPELETKTKEDKSSHTK